MPTIHTTWPEFITGGRNVAERLMRAKSWEDYIARVDREQPPTLPKVIIGVSVEKIDGSIVRQEYLIAPPWPR